MRKIFLFCCIVFIVLNNSYSQADENASSEFQEIESIEDLEKELSEIPDGDYGKKIIVLGKLLTLYGKNEAEAYKAIPLMEEAIAIMESFYGADSDFMISMYQNAMKAFATLQDNKKTLFYFEKYVYAKGDDIINEENAADNLKLYSIIGLAYYEAGNYDNAITYFQKSLAISESIPAELEAAQNCSNLGACYLSKSEYEKSLQYNQKALAIYQKLYGEDSPQCVAAMVNIGNVYLSKADYSEALAYYEKSLILKNASLSEADTTTAILYNNIGLVYTNTADYKKALENLEIAMKIRKKLFGEEHADVADSYTNIGDIYMQKGDYDKALGNFSKALEIRKKIFAEHPKTAVAYQNIALAYSEKNEYEKALEYYEMARAMLVSLVGENHEGVAMVYSNISKAYQEKDDFQNSLLYCDKAISIRKNLFGEIHPDVAASYMNEGALYRSLGDYEHAILYFEKALAIYTAVFGEKHTYIATCYNNLGVVSEDKGQLDKALNYFQKALSMRIDLFGEKNEGVSVSFLSIGNVYLAKGDLDNALSYYEHARVINEQLLGKNHANTAAVYNNIARIYQEKKHYDEAIQYYQNALDSYLSIYGENHTSVAMVYENLGATYREKKDFDHAFFYFNRAKEIRESLLGKKHTDTAKAYANLALVYAQKKEYEKSLAYNKKALAIYENTFGENHPTTAAICFNMGLYYHIIKNESLSTAYWNKTVHASKNLSNYVDVIDRMKKIIEMSEDDSLVQNALEEGIATTERARFDMSSIKTDLLRDSLPLYYHGVHFEASHNSIEKAFEYSESLRNRGFLEQLGFETALKLNGITEEERNSIRAYSEQITQARKEIEHQNGLGTKRNNDRLIMAGQKLSNAESNLAILESEIGKRIPAYTQLRNPQPVKATDAQKWCGNDMAILEYVLWEQKSYCFIITTDEMSIVAIDSNYDYLKATAQLRDAVFTKRQSLSAGKKASIQIYRSELYAKLIEPVLPHIGNGIKSLLIVPDGVLSSIPFDILGNESVGTLCDIYAISFSPSVSVSMIRQKEKNASFSMLGIGNALYATEEEGVSFVSTPVSEYYARTFSKWHNLPGTGTELYDIKNEIFPEERVILYERDKSTESFVKELSLSGELSEYTQLLFALHGCFDADVPEYSALVFSEVSGAIPDSKDDGYLTVTELAVLNMNADYLNLSACQTGLSAENQGDGMVGLTRSCIVAGADRVGVTLWKVDDTATCEFQRILYNHIKKGMDYNRAYQSAKQELKESELWSEPIYWAAFVLYE